MESVDIGVIGGGIHGASSAFHLVSAGANVRLFEQDAPASGPTGRSSAVCRGYYVNSFLARMAAESLDTFRNFSEVTQGGDAGYHATGILYLHAAQDLPVLRKHVPELSALGVRTELLEGDALVGQCPGWDLDGIAAGAWEPDAGYADPVGATQGYFNRAVELGLKYRLYTKITWVEAQVSGGAILTCQDGTKTHCNKVLLCAGPWTRGLALQVGVDLPLTVERHTIAVFGWGGVAEIPFSYADIPGGFYVKPEGTHLYTVGSLHGDREVNPDLFPINITDEEIMSYAEPLMRRVPFLVDSDSRGGWAALYDMSPDWQPVIGEIADGIFVDAGSSGHGFKLAPALCERIAKMVATGEVGELEPFHPRRFAENTPLEAGYAGAQILG
ncbi:MAG: NAD(P)/FAD-dependent oxidoreductase [Candidatus Dormibacteria bacterium]